MNEPNRRPEICSFCSLLCELTPEVSCSKRIASLSQVSRRHGSLGQSEAAVDGSAERAAQRAIRQIGNATDVLITGRFRCVDSTRSAVELAQRCSAVIDPWDSDQAMHAIASLQRSGGYSVSLGEARDRSDLWIVIGQDRMLDHTPLLPQAIQRGEIVPLLLLGKWSDSSIRQWQQAGFEALCIDAHLEDLPRCLSQATRLGADHCDSQLGRWILQSTYSTVLFAPATLEVAQVDLWMDMLSQWILRQNQTHRIATLSWGGLESTFHQTCTWLTGFPGRIRFDKKVPGYDPGHYRAQSWCDRRPNATSDPSRPLVVWVDDSIEPVPEEFLRVEVPKISISSIPIANPTAQDVWLPSGIAGVSSAMKAFRGDQTILANIQPASNQNLPKLRSPSDWIGRLLQCK
ncbi:MAG: hypothetical protein KGS49_08110 [Planctomycetes bacterium]|nr:hypothetical protein [Planctomycetota bacterium]